MRYRAAAALALAAACGLAAAGPIDPPAGPVQSTMKPLDQVEPRIAVNAANTPGDSDGTPSVFKLSQPGSYYLTGNVSGVAGKAGIEIAADGVTLDLAGFVVQGVAGALHGIQATGDSAGFTLINGTVQDWPGSGVLGSPAARGARIVGVAARDNAGYGFVTPESSVVESCIATGNGEVGIYLGEGSSASLCTAADNSTSGIQGLAGVQLTGCSVNDNNGWGIIAGPGSAVRSCTAARNGYIGIEVSNITSSTGGVIEGSAAYANDGWGILAGYGTLVSGCTAADNLDDGIYATSGCTVSDCTVYNNHGDGIEAQSDCTIVRNQARGHGASGKAGIFAWSSSCRIEENNLTSNAYGLRVTGSDNFIARNTARGNASGNYSISAGNELAPVITNPGSNGFSTMTPWSNVAY